MERLNPRLHGSFNRSVLSRFLDSVAGRAFRLAARTGFLVVGRIYRHHPLGVLSMVWSIAPLTAGASTNPKRCSTR